MLDVADWKAFTMLQPFAVICSSKKRYKLSGSPPPESVILPTVCVGLVKITLLSRSILCVDGMAISGKERITPDSKSFVSVKTCFSPLSLIFVTSGVLYVPPSGPAQPVITAAHIIAVKLRENSFILLLLCLLPIYLTSLFLRDVVAHVNVKESKTTAKA